MVKISMLRNCPVRDAPLNQGSNHCSKKESVEQGKSAWGTLRSTTVAAVTTAPNRLTMVGDKLQVRRKYKPGKDNQSVVVHRERH